MTLPPRTFRVLLATLAAVLAAGVCPLPASAAEKGIETDLTWGISNGDRDRTVAGVQDLGAKWMRLTMSWSDIETSNGVYDLGHYDNALQRAAASGAKIVVTVYKSPSWASGSSDPDTPPQDPADYADFMRFAATRWGDKVDAWEVWNEQNLWGFWSTGPNPAQYAELLKTAYPAIKVADPTALVVYGGVSYNDYRFLEGAYAAVPNLGDYYDVMASHPYSPVNAPEDVWYDPDGRLAKKSFVAYREIRQIMLAHGDDKPLWFTEFGWSTNTLPAWGVSEANQAAFLTRAMRCIEQDPYVQVAIWYIYRNHAWAGDANTWVDQLGLLRSDFSKKPAYDAFKAYTPGTQGCTYNYPAPAPAPEPEPTPEPEPEPSSESIDEPEEEPTEEPTIESSSVVRRVGIRLVRPARARASRSETLPRRTRAAIRVRGRVFKASNGRVALNLTCRGRGDERWRRAVQRHTRVGGTGRFTRRLKPRSGAACRLRAEYRSRGKTVGRSRLVRFKT